MFGSSTMCQQGDQARDSCLSKRRRFTPDSLPTIVREDGTTTPLLLEASDRTPSQQEIEAQLMQVGMKISKPAVEAPGRRAFTPRPFMNFSRLSPETISALSNSPDTDGEFPAGGPQNLSTATFCGINLAMMSHVSCTPAIQEQKLWSYSTASKRKQQFEDDSDSDESQEFMPRTPQLDYADADMQTLVPQDYFNIAPDSIDDLSSVTRTRARPNINSRKIAQPRSRIRPVHEQPLPIINPFIQIAPRPTGHGHQRMRSCGMEAMDFNQASFLQPWADVEMDCS